MEVTELDDGVTVVNDAYNANPDSMRAALAALARMGEGRRTWAVLGTMLELGEQSDALHAEVGAEVVAHQVDELVVVGDAAAPLAGRAPGPAATHGIRHGIRRRPAGPRARASSPTPTPPRRCCAPSCGVVTWCCSSRAATRVYGCSVTDWPGRGRS